MIYNLLGASSTQVLPAVKDSVSKVEGNQDGYDYCGARDYAIATATPSNYANVITFDANTKVLTLGLPETKSVDVGDYTIEIIVKLKEYPTII